MPCPRSVKRCFSSLISVSSHRPSPSPNSALNVAFPEVCCGFWCHVFAVDVFGRGTEQVDPDHLSGHFRGHFSGHLRGTLGAFVGGGVLQGVKPGKKKILVDALVAFVGALVGPLVGGSKFRFRLLCPKNLFGLFFTFRVISISQGYFWRPSENTLYNKHKIDISRVILTLQSYFCLAR